MKFSGQLPYILTWDDLYLTPIYILLILLIVRKWRKRYADSPLKKYIYPALLCRIFGCIFLALMLNFYYGYGDTFSYFTGGREIWSAFIKHPKVAWEILTTDPQNYSSDALEYALHSGYTGFASSYYVMFRAAGVIALFCFGTYLPIALVFTLLSFWGAWMIFLVFNERYPHLQKYIAITTLFIPSVIIWTTGILKEPLCMFGLGICFYTFNNILNGRKIKRSIIYFATGALILLSVKNYIFYLFIAAACVWSYKSFVNHITSSFIKLIIKGTIYLLFLIAIIYFFADNNNIVQTSFTDYFTKAAHLQTVMTTINIDYNSGSGYTLPINDLSGFGLITSFLLSLNVALFRPYIWECTNPLMVLNFIESFATFLLVIFLLFKTGPVKIYRGLKDPVLLFSLLFSLMMAALVGFVSFNFGTLIRYKTPFEPFFYTMLVIILLNKIPIKASQITLE
ncbi:MAG: hypothetical protein M3004_06600 [Bacteroidota bacterium]|nr:hypothetical protein [Bacteroidota bacterium]